MPHTKKNAVTTLQGLVPVYVWLCEKHLNIYYINRLVNYITYINLNFYKANIERHTNMNIKAHKVVMYRAEKKLQKDECRHAMDFPNFPQRRI